MPSKTMFEVPRRLIGITFGVEKLHCVPKKVSHLMFDNNFGKCGPIFKVLSPGDS